MENQIFRIILHDNKYRIAIGNQAASIKEFDTIKDAEDYIESKDWELLCTVSYIIANQIINQQNNEHYSPHEQKPQKNEKIRTNRKKSS